MKRFSSVLGAALVATTLVAVGPAPAQAADNESPCMSQAEWDSVTVGTTTLSQVRSIADGPGARLTFTSPQKYLWKRCDGGGNGYAQMAFTRPSGSTSWKVSSKWYEPPAPDLKRGLSGLVVVNPGVIDDYDAEGIDVDGSIRVNWSDIEEVNGAPDFTPITSVLAAHPDTAFRVRIMAGGRFRSG